MKFTFKRHRIDKFSRNKMLDELARVAKTFRYIEFGWRDFNKVASITANPIKKEFGGWSKALSTLREYLEKKGLNLLPRAIPANRIHSDKDMFIELEKVWTKLGHRPSRTEWELLKPKIYYNTYKLRFGGWKNACLKFIEYKMGKDVEVYKEYEKNKGERKTKEKNIKYTTGATRSIPLNIRLKVLSRDNFRCVFCGRSPAADIGVKLHIDHITPFSKGGRSIENNLQTLCEECNIGKRDQKF